MTAQSLTDHLLHRGALQETPDGSLTFPIPSFRTYLVRAGARLEVGALLAGAPGPGAADQATTARILAACAPHTEYEVARWTALAATWHRACTVVAACAADAAALAAVTAAPTDADRAHANAVLATLEATDAVLSVDASVPTLPQSLPHAERAVAALLAMIDGICTAVQVILAGTDDPDRADTLGEVMALPDEAVTATPEQQLAWAIEHLTGVLPETSEAAGPAPDV